MKRKAFSAEAQVARLDPLVDAVVSAILDAPGSTPVGLRHRVRDAAGDDARFAPYLAKVRRHAYRILDSDLEPLARAGLDDDGIFELTAAAALGEAQRRLQAGLAALQG